jgi:hypothetical protein
MSGFILPVVTGFMSIHDCRLSNGMSFTFALLARRNPGRLGTRYFSRGVDYDGNVSNFVETEQLLICGGKRWSHIQVCLLNSCIQVDIMSGSVCFVTGIHTKLWFLLLPILLDLHIQQGYVNMMSHIPEMGVVRIQMYNVQINSTTFLG